PEGVRAEGLPPDPRRRRLRRGRRGLGRPHGPVPAGAAPAHDRGRLRRLADTHGEVLRGGGWHRHRGDRPHRDSHPVTAVAVAAPRRSTLTRSAGLGLGVAMLWFSLLVLIPLLAIIVTASQGGWPAFWAAITNEQTAAAIRLTVMHAFLVT